MKGHAVTYVRFDADPALACRKLCSGLEQHSTIVEFAARGSHEGIGAAEATRDVIIRIAEAMLQRSAVLLHMRAIRYAGFVLNRKGGEGKSVTRHALMEGSPPDMAKPVPLAFKTTV